MMKKIPLLFILFVVCLNNIHAQKVKFEILGKGGARGIMPENTIEGMLKALDLGVTTLQMDVAITKDNQVILSQEPYFNHEISLTPDGKTIALKDEKKHNIYKLKYEDVKKFDVGSKMHPRFKGQSKFKAYKPLLKDVFISVEKYVKKHKLSKPKYSIKIRTIKNGDEVFHPKPNDFVNLVMAEVAQYKLEKRVIIESFDNRVLQDLHAKFPKVKTMLMIDEKEPFEAYIEKLGFKPTYYSPYHILVGKSLVDKCHSMGIKIIPWTVNSVKTIKYLQSLGVDGITTDYPNLMSLK